MTAVDGCLLLTVCLLCAGGAARAEILTLYSDKGLYGGIPPGSVPTYGLCNGGAGNAVFDGKAAGSAAPEGILSFLTRDDTITPCQDTYAGWGLQLGAPQDLSRFAAGEMRFWVKTNSGRIKVEIKDGSGQTVLSKRLDTDLGWTVAQANQWVSYRIPFSGQLSGSGLSAVFNPFLFTALSTPVEFFVDDVRYADSTALPVFDVSVRNVAGGGAASVITWNASSGGWAVANQYIQLTVDSDASPWGVQIYSDNTAPDANPRFASSVPAGQPGSNPAGLVDATAPSQRLPLAWSIKAQPAAPTAADPNNAADKNSFQWLFLKDKATPAIAAENTTAFVNGDPYLQVRNNLGIHFGPQATDFGAEDPPNVIYLEANFGTALTPRTYQTSTLRLEFFTP